MLIDFHVHVFPEKMALRTLKGMQDNVKEISGFEQPIFFDGTVNDLKRRMAAAGVDLSVVLPIATKPKQFDTINAYAEEITDGKTIISFGTVHPMAENVTEQIEELSRRGFKGIKLHPEYQGIYVDDPVFIAVVKRAAELGMYVVLHAGADMGIRPPVHAPVDRIKTMLGQVDAERVILAHLGAYNMWDAVESDLIDTKAYFDTAIVSSFMDIEQYRRIIDKHGADKILFGSDGPWEDPKQTFEFLKKSGISGEELELITHKNAEKILF